MYLGQGHKLGWVEFQGVLWVQRPLLSSLMISEVWQRLCLHAGRGNGSTEEQWMSPAFLPRRKPHLSPCPESPNSAFSICSWQLTLLTLEKLTLHQSSEGVSSSLLKFSCSHNPFKRSLHLLAAATTASSLPSFTRPGSLSTLPPPTNSG